MNISSEKTGVIRYILISAGIGVIIFLLLFGYETLPLTNVAYIYNAKDRITSSSDLPFHQFGLDYFLRSKWTFPPGENPAYPYPYGSSILISDSLPLFAFVAKLFAPILPEYFQYFGIWTLLCFILQGVFAALIMRKLGLKPGAALCAVPLFLINVPLLFRCFHHCALCGQWLILLAFLGYLYNDEMKFKGKCFFWVILCVLCVLVQGYFLVMCGGIMTAALVCDVIRDKKNTLKSLCILALALFFSILTYYLCGGFSVEGGLGGKGLGLFPFDVLYLLDPYVFSAFLSGQRSPNYNTEHDAYLGIGLIIFYLIAFAILLLKRKEAMAYLKRNGKKKMVLFILLLGFLLFSFSPTIQFFGVKRLDLLTVLPQKLADWLSVFRSSARFFWPVWYALLICAIRISYSAFKRKGTAIFGSILLVCAFIQYLELPANTIENKAEAIEKGYESSLEIAFEDCFNEKAKHLSVIYSSLRELEDANVYAVHHGLTANRANLGRGMSSSMPEDLEKIAAGIPDRETVYLVKLEEVGVIPFEKLPSDFVYYYDNAKYLAFFDKSLLKKEPACMKIDLDKDIQ